MSDKTLRVLSKAPRRQILLALDEHGEPIDLKSVGEHTIIDADNWEDQQIALYHNHLPKLADHGFIQWDQDEQVVLKGEQFERAQSLLETQDPEPDYDNDGGSSLSFGLLAPQ